MAINEHWAYSNGTAEEPAYMYDKQKQRPCTVRRSPDYDPCHPGAIFGEVNSGG